jgi:hypothetical protein
MTPTKVVSSRPETPAEQTLDEWFQRQVLSSPETFEVAARQLITLVTTLLGVWVFGRADDPLPKYLALPIIRFGGSIICFCYALHGVYPFR